MNTSLVDDYDKTYFNVIVPGPKWNMPTATSSQPKLQVALDKSILLAPEDYYVAVAQASIPISNLPLCILEPIVDGETALIYDVTLEYNGMSSTAKLEWTNYNVPQLNQQFFPYGVYNYADICDSINYAFIQAFINILPPPEAVPPFVVFDTQKQKFVMYAQVNYYNVGMSGDGTPPTNNAIKIFINPSLQVFFKGMMQRMDGNRTQILMMNLSGTNWIQLPTLQDVIYNEQQGDYLSMVSAVRSIQIVANTLPIKPELVQNINDVEMLGSISSTAIVKEFKPVKTNQASIEFYEDGPYKLINMYGRTPIMNIGVEVRWVDKNGKTHQLPIPYDQSVNVKFCFLKKKTTV